MEKIVRKRKTRRGKKKKNRNFITSRDRTHNEQQLTKSVNIDGKHDQNNAGDVGRCSNHSCTHSQYGIKKSENHNSNAVKNCVAREKEVITESNEIPNNNTHHDLKRETKPDDPEELLVLVRKENGESYLFLYFLSAS